MENVRLVKVLIHKELRQIDAGGDLMAQSKGTASRRLCFSTALLIVAVMSSAASSLTLKEGDFWEYKWDYYHRSGYQGGGSDSTSRDKGRFRVALGTPREINGVIAYEVLLSGKTRVGGAGSTGKDFAPRWKYLAAVGGMILGSENGVTLSTVFDGDLLYWAGGGFFTTYGANTLITATPGRITNDYISSAALKTGDSNSQSQCEIIVGIKICGDNSFSWKKYEYYRDDVGPIGYYYYNSYFSSGGGFSSWGSREDHVGLVASSLWGDTAEYLYEVESNNYPDSAQELAPFWAVLGTGTKGSYGDGYILGDYLHRVVVEDWFSFELPFRAEVSIDLDFGEHLNTDLDIYLLGARPDYTSQASSMDDNVATGILTENLTTFLDAGTYYIGVDTFSTTGGGEVEYLLEVHILDQDAPDPDPMTWSSEPEGISENSITMSATTGTDIYDVEYYFESLTSGGHDSGWQSSPTYVDTNLSADTEYTYRVKASDKSDAQNETGWSDSISAATWAPDVTAPIPNPSTWEVEPYATEDDSIYMVADGASDLSDVEYYFECQGASDHDSGWQASPVYEDTGFLVNTIYNYRFKTRDKSNNKNETQWSSWESASIYDPFTVTMTINKCTVKAGRSSDQDSFAVSGTIESLGAINLAEAGQLYLKIISGTDQYLVYDQLITINAAEVKNGRFRYKHKDSRYPKTATTLKIDTNKQTFYFKVKNVNLAGLASPVVVEGEIGGYKFMGTAYDSEPDYLASGGSVVRDVLNGKKPVPMQLMTGYSDSLRVDKCRFKLGRINKPGTDTLTIQGALAVEDPCMSIGGEDVFVSWGDYDITLYASDLYPIGSRKAFKYKKPKGTSSSIAAAIFDLEKCKFKIVIKRAGIGSQGNQVDFSIRIGEDEFDETVSLQLTQKNASLFVYP